jgi:2-oxoglutarate dehydrogenase E1 component
VESVVIGMPHRGRLNVLTQVMQKPLESVFSEFAGQNASDEGSGDVKYHLGTSVDRMTRNGKTIHMSLTANPSHLEAVNPLVEGKTRAIQLQKSEVHGVADENKAMAVLLHGDAAFAGQGIVYETIGLSELEHYTTGGTVHIIVNNQIGFTTDPRFSRSTPYCCDLGKVHGATSSRARSISRWATVLALIVLAWCHTQPLPPRPPPPPPPHLIARALRRSGRAQAFNAPIFHVNGDDPEAVVYVCNLAAEWRKTYKKDVIVDIVCYRRHGHNEQDQPSFTQPMMYKQIAKHQTPSEIYSARLVAEGAVTQAEVDEMRATINQGFEDAFQNSADYKSEETDWLESRWTKFKKVPKNAPTGLPADYLREVGLATCSYPEGFTPHRSLVRILKARAKTIEDGVGLDWATTEAMAFGTLLKEGCHVRLSGQDVERGTFSHRHAVLVDQKTEARHCALSNLDPDQARRHPPFPPTDPWLSRLGRPVDQRLPI